MCLYTPYVQSRALTPVRTSKLLYVVHVSRLGSVSVAAGFPRGKQPEFPMGKIPLVQYSIKTLKKNVFSNTYLSRLFGAGGRRGEGGRVRGQDAEEEAEEGGGEG